MGSFVPKPKSSNKIGNTEYIARRHEYTLCVHVYMQEACNSQVEWYKSVKETQASVEVTSYGQMNNIFDYGCYRVGNRTNVICKTHSEVISLSLSERRSKKHFMKVMYNLEDLRDLESKLVLITGSKAENRAKVDLFQNVSLKRTLHSIAILLQS